MAKKHIFKFINSISNSENLECEPGLLGALAKGINTVQNTSEGTVGGTKAPVAIPDAGNVINVTKDYKWTKTLRDSALGRTGTPTILLEEFYVVRPAFYTNLNLFVDKSNPFSFNDKSNAKFLKLVFALSIKPSPINIA